MNMNNFGGNFGGGGGNNWQGNNMNNTLALATNLLAAAIQQGQQQQGNFGGGGGGGGGGGLMGGGGWGPTNMGPNMGPQQGNWRQQVMQNRWSGRDSQSYQRRNDFRGNRAGGGRYGRGGGGGSVDRRRSERQSSPATKPESKKEVKKEEKDEEDKGAKEDEGEKAEEKPQEEEESEKKEEDREKPAEVDNSKYAGLPQELLKCTPCNKKMWNGISFERHLKGHAHQRMMNLVADHHEQVVALLRVHLKLHESRRELELEKMRKNNKKVPTDKSFCTMCDLSVYGSLNFHRKSQLHQKLKSFLHPKCFICRKEFTVRADWDEHLLSVEHLKRKAEVLRQKGEEAAENVEGEDDFFETLNFYKRRTKGQSASGGTGGSSKPASKEEKEAAEEEEALGEDKVADYEIPDFDEDGKVGTSFMKAVNGFFCRLCRKYLNEDAVAAHAGSRQHYDKFAEAVAAKQEKAREEMEKKKKKEEEEEEAKKKRPAEETDDDMEGSSKKRKTEDEDEGEDDDENVQEDQEEEEEEEEEDDGGD